MGAAGGGDGAPPALMLRLPEGVIAGAVCRATLPDGTVLEFTAPADATPGQLVKVSGPAPSAGSALRSAAEVEEEAEEPRGVVTPTRPNGVLGNLLGGLLGDEQR